MTSLSRSTRALLAIAAASFPAIVLAYALAPREGSARALVADLSWTWTAGYAVACCAIAARRQRDPDQRSAWTWIGVGCALFLGGQLAWDYYELARGARPPYPSLADAGYLGIYVCFLVAVGRLVRGEPRRRAQPELVLDTVLVTAMTTGLAYDFLLRPIFAAERDLAPLLASLAWSIGGIAVLWLILLEMLRHTRLPRTATLVVPGIVVFCVTNLAYAVESLRGTFQSGGPLDLGWDAGLLCLAAGALLSPERPEARGVTRAPISGDIARLGAVLAGLAGIGALAVAQALSSEPDLPAALIVAAGVAIVGARFVYSIRADRRYTDVLENEVASQTRSLMDSLAATAAAERNLRLVMDAVPDAIVVVDREGRIHESNAPADAMAAAGGASVTGRSVFEFLDPAGAAVVREKMAAAFAGEVQRFEVPFEQDDGTHGITSLLYAPVREGNRITRILALARDVTDQKRTEAQLQQAEKLGAMGQLVSGVAHEINNPAAIISGFAQTLLLDDLKPEHREMLQMIYDEATRIGRITSNLLAFARAGGSQRTLVDLNDIARRTFALRSYHLSTLNITVSLALDPAEPKVWADASELQQMLLNLLINAEQALVTVDGPRTITVRTRGDEHELELEVADSGPGIPAEIRSKIFDPFFTTKPEGVGTGLGLSICYGIAREHGGRIWADSEPGAGARFVIALPRDPRAETRAPREPPATPAAAAGAGAGGGALSVLVVDDETALRNALLRFLARRGIEGQGAADGTEALQLLRQRTFDVIVSDVRMPGMSGREFVERLRQDRPDLLRRLVFSTGDTFAPDTAALIQESGIPTVTKPFDFAALEQVLRQVAARAHVAGPQAST